MALETHCVVQEACLLSMHSGNDAITDEQWSPENGTLFAAATSRGEIQLWDLEVSILAPVATHTTAGPFMASCMNSLASTLTSSLVPMLPYPSAPCLILTIQLLASAEGTPVSQILFSNTAPALYVAGGEGGPTVLLLERASCSTVLSEDADGSGSAGGEVADVQGKRLEACVQANTSNAVEGV